MENAAEALKIAGFTLLFVTALSIAMITIMQAKRTSQDVLLYSDKSKYVSGMDNAEENKQDDNGNRIVSVYDIIPTLYRYNQEKYIVLFYYSKNSPLTIYDGIIKQNGSDMEEISYLNGELEDYKECYWIGTSKTVKKHVDEVVKNLLENYSKSSFVEQIYTTNNAYENNRKDENIPEKKADTPIKVIKYTLNI